MALKQEFVNRRRHYRLRYPERERPQILIGNKAWPVVDISEGGVAFWCLDMQFTLRQPIFAMLKFRNGDIDAVQGEVVRMRVDLVCIRLIQKGLSADRIAAEKQRLFRLGYYMEVNR